MRTISLNHNSNRWTPFEGPFPGEDAPGWRQRRRGAPGLVCCVRLRLAARGEEEEE